MSRNDERRRALEKALERAARSAGLTEQDARSVAADACRLDGAGGEMAVKELLAQLSDRDRTRVAHLSRAIGRIDSGDYGQCEKCGDPIGEERLDVMPETEVCRECAA